MKTKHAKHIPLNKILIIFCICAVIFLVLNTSKYTIKSNNDNSISLNDNWTISYNDNSTQSQISLPYNINNKTGEIINIYTTLPPKLYSVEALTLTVYQKSVWIYIDNEQIYEHVFNPSFLNNNPPGTGNVTVILPDNSQNKQLHIKYRIENSFSESFIMPPKIVNGAITQSALSGNNIVIFACMVSFLFIALLLFLMFLMKFRSGINHTANLSLSLIFAAIAIWVLCYNKLTDILINNWQLIHELEYLSLYILPFSIWNYISCGWKSNSNLVKIMRNLMGMFFVVILIMRLIFNIDYSSTLTIFHFLILINVILLIKELSTNFKSKKVSYKTFSFGIFISLFSAILALFQQYFLKGQLYLSVAFTAMIAIAGVLMVISVFCLANETLSDKFSDTFMKNLVYEHKRYEAIFQNTKDIFFDWDTKTDTAYISSNFEKYFGFPPKTSDFKSFFMTDISEISLPDDFDNIIENLKSHQKNEHIECSFRDYNGNIKWFLMNLTTNLNHMGEQTHIIGIIQDITEQKQLKKEFSAQIQYNHISKKMYDNVLEADLSENILLGEGIEELYKTLNIPTNSNYDQTIFAIKTKLTHPDYSEEYGEALSRERILSLFEDGITSFELETYELDSNGIYQWLHLDVQIYKAEISNTIRILSYVNNISQEKQRELSLMEASLKDALTGVLNKGALRVSSERFLENADTNNNYALFMIDIDYFKQVNDSWGHIVGDTAITHVANVIKSHFNETDFIGRFGGDEFIVLLTTPVTKIDIEKKCEELNQSIRIPFNFNNIVLDLSLSIGVSIFPSNGKDYKSLCNMADKALYTSKSKGRNTYTIYDSTLKI